MVMVSTAIILLLLEKIYSYKFVTNSTWRLDEVHRKKGN